MPHQSNRCHCSENVGNSQLLERIIWWLRIWWWERNYHVLQMYHSGGTFYYTLQISYLFIRLIKKLDNIYQRSGPTPDQSNLNLCGGMGRYMSLSPHHDSAEPPKLRRKETEGKFRNATHIWLNNERLIYLRVGLLPYIHVNHIFEKSLLSPNLK